MELRGLNEVVSGPVNKHDCALPEYWLSFEFFTNYVHLATQVSIFRAVFMITLDPYLRSSCFTSVVSRTAMVHYRVPSERRIDNA